MDDKIVVGLLPQVTTKNDNNQYNDKNEFIDVYSKRIIESGGTTVGIISIDQTVDEKILDLCDAFIIPGGVAVNWCYFDVINYAIKHNKPLLGICLGMQTLGIYSMFVNNSNNYNRQDVINQFNAFFDTHDGLVLSKIESDIVHSTKITNDTYKDSFHKVNIIDKDSLLYSIYQKDIIEEASLHNYGLRYVGDEFKITAKADDNVIEALEYNKPGYFIMGVQFHPEFDEERKVFQRLVRECRDRK